MKKLSTLSIIAITFLLANNVNFANINSLQAIQKNKKEKIFQKNDIINTIKNIKQKNFLIPKKTANYSTNTLIIKFKQNLNLIKIKSILSNNNLEIKKINILKNLSNTLGKTIAIIKINNINDQNIKSIIENLKKNPNIEKVELDYKNKPLSLPNDPLLNEEWYIKNIKASNAWDKTIGNKDVILATFDTGISLLHEDLKVNIDTKDAYDFAVDNDGNNGPLKGDLHPVPHGSHVAGIIGGVGNNNIGISGVNQKVTILPIKIFRPMGYAFDSDILEAIDYIIKLKKEKNLNIVAINASYGGFGGDADNSVMRDALKKLDDNNIIFFAAAGNSGVDNDRIYYDLPALPASYSLNNVIAVAATDENNNLTWFSQYGKKSVQIAAPGIDILSTVDYIDGNDTNSEYFKDDFENTSSGNWATNANWGYTTKDYHSATHSITDSPDGDYDDNNVTYVLSKDIDLSNTKDENISLDFCMNNKLADGDLLVVWFYQKSDNSYHYVYYTGGTDDWKCLGIPIEDRFKSDEFSVAFMLLPNNDGNVDDGIYIDDVKIGTYSKTNMYEKWAGTSMATPIGTGSYGLLKSYFKNENKYQLLSRIINKGEKLNINISGDKIDLNNAFSDGIPPLILNTKKTMSVSDKTSVTFEARNFNSPEAYIGNKKVNILNKTNTSLTLKLPMNAENKITLKENGLSNPLYISFWKLLTTAQTIWMPLGNVNGFENNTIITEGYNAFEDKQIIAKYDIKNNKWSKLNELEKAYAYQTGTLLNNKLYMFGGYDMNNGNVVDDTIIYDIENNTTSNGTNLPEPLYASDTITDGKNIYILGGFNSNDNINPNVYKYLPKDDNWTKLTTLQNPSFLGAVCLVNQNIYIFGGQDNNNNFNKVYKIDITNGKVSQLKDLPISLIGAGCSKIDNNHILIFSGVDVNKNSFNHSVLVYDINENTYTKIENSIFNNVLDRANFGTNVVDTNDTIAYVFGYNEYFNQTSTIEILDKKYFRNIINHPPIITSPSEVTINKNDKPAYKIKATDLDNDKLLFGISGSDASYFVVDKNTGDVNFKETPQKNTYTITVIASDGDANGTKNVTINVKSDDNNGGGGGGGSAPIFDIFTILSLLGATLLIFRKK